MSTTHTAVFENAILKSTELKADTKIAVGLDTEQTTKELTVVGDAPEIRIQDKTGSNPEVNQTTLSIVADGGVTHFRAGTSTFDTTETKGDIKFQSSTGDSTHAIITGTGRVGVGTMAPTESLDIVGNINLQKVSNTATIKLDSNVVTEYVRSKKLIKYPRVALTSGASNAYENGYKVTFSNQRSGSYEAWKAFDNDPSDTVGWYSESSDYNGTSGAYSGTTRLASETELGQWIGLEVPTPIKLYDVRIVSQSYSTAANTVDEFYIYAKKQSGDTWTNLGKFTGIAARQGTPAGVTVNVDSTDYYTFFVLVATKRYTAAAFGVSIRVLDFYGVPEYDPEAHGTDTIMRSVPNVPNTDWLEVYWDAKNYSGSGNVQDETANNRDGTVNCGFDNGDVKAFTFSGAYTSNVTTSDHGLGTGDVTYTVSYWFKRTAVASTYDYLVMMGPGGSNYQNILMWINSDKLRLDHWGAQLMVPEPITLNKWYYVVAGHRGGSTPSNTNDFIYINGKKINPELSGSAAAFNLASGKLTLGSSHYTTTEFFNGSIANFRLFNRALSVDEIWQLYAYQKEYFQMSPDVVTFKGGRLGIGTSEPRAPLDVMGIPYGPGVKPCFTASRNAGDVAPGNRIVFNAVEVNQGNGYDSSTGRFTAPISGLYFFSIYAMSADTLTYFGIRAAKNGVFYLKFWPYTDHGNSAPHKHISGSHIVPMAQGDTFEFQVGAGTMYASGNGHNSFVGYLIE